MSAAVGPAGKAKLMRTSIEPEFIASTAKAGRSSRIFAALLTAAVIVTGAVSLAAQAPDHPTTTAPPKTHRPHPGKVATPTPATPAETPTPTSEVPNWPANDQPKPAQVTWNSKGLHIDAFNASLQQIMNEVAAETGAKVEGLGADERVFGEYGPGQARDVISQLLTGSGYNVLLIGDQGQGTPRQIVLSARHAGNSAAGNANHPNSDNPDEEAPEPPEPEEPQPAPTPQMRPPMGQSPQQRTPQQMMQELQQRQLQQQQQQQTQPPQ